RFQPTVKVPNTRGCHIASVIRNLNNGNKYLCAVVEKTIILMEWFNPRKTFVEVKRVSVSGVALSCLLDFILTLRPGGERD
ncbi:unnamed protein product, partial [Dibothriocephalus latus]